MAAPAPPELMSRVTRGGIGRLFAGGGGAGPISLMVVTAWRFELTEGFARRIGMAGSPDEIARKLSGRAHGFDLVVPTAMFAPSACCAPRRRIITYSTRG